MSQPPQTHPDTPTSAPRSGGPRTPEGKERSRRNALKHGLRARVLTPDEMIDDVMNRTADFARQFRPQNTYQEWLVGEIALATVRIDRCAALSIVDLQRRTNHAEACWDLDRRRDVAALAAGLKRDPARILPALEATRHGVDWLIAHWDGLAQTLESLGDWDDDQRRLALDLLGTPAELRSGNRRLPQPADLPAFVQGQIRRLRTSQEAHLNDQDEDQRIQAGFGMSPTADPTAANLRRYERSCRRALHWARTELQRLQAEPADPPEPVREAPRPNPIPEPVHVPEPVRPTNDFDLPRDRRAAGKPLPPSRGDERLLMGDLLDRNHFDLDLTIVPTMSGRGPKPQIRRPARRPAAGKWA